MKYESKGREHDDGKQKIMVQMDKDQVQCKLFGKKKMSSLIEMIG